jgi:hypothetical protein
MSDVIFNGGIIQKGDRIKIPKAIIDTLNLVPGDKIIIKFNAENHEITISEDKKKKK